MGKGKEHPFPLIPSRSSLPISDIPQTSLLNFPNYVGLVHALSPAFLPYLDGNQYPINIQNVGCPFPYWMGPMPLPIATSSAMSTRVGQEDRLDCVEIDAPCTSARVDAKSKGDRLDCVETEVPCTFTKVNDVCKEDRPDEWKTNDGTIETPKLVQTNGDDMIEEPKSGIEFNSFEDLQSYYKNYAKKCGFGVKIQRSERSEDQSIKYVTLGCARGGKARGGGSNVANPRPTRKTDCKAKINATRVNGKMRLTTVHNIHNHGLNPQKPCFFQYNREMSESARKVLDTNDKADIPMNEGYRSLVVGADGYENFRLLEKDCRNYINKAWILQLGAGGARALRDYFLKMQFKNDGFFSLMDLDDEARLKNVFWADPRSRAAYKYFGDVVTLDTTYLTNRYGIPFVAFVGVNHHGQSILLGAGLISSEDTETFTWLFRIWLQCMDGIAPKAIITDQDRAMKNAIAIVFPETRHRFCLWHILKKVPEKLGSYAAYESGLKTQVMKCVYDTQSIEEFEKCWDEFVNTYDLHEDLWLKILHAEREHWVPIFQKEHFWAGMSSTQRSESMNAFFDGYIHSKTNLKEFIDQYDNALRKKFENEDSADFQSFSLTIPCLSRSPIEKKFQELYTNAKFREVQQQVIGTLDLDISILGSDGVMKNYSVEDEVELEEFTKPITYSVEFNEEDCTAKCSCGLFQMRGILCRHILAIFKSNGIKSLPDQYILDRWRKDIKRRYTLIHNSFDARDQRPNGNRYSILLNMCNQMIPYAVDSNEHFEEAKKRIHEMTKFFHENQRPLSLTQTGSNAPITTLDPTVVGSSQQVKSSLVAKGKEKPLSLRRAGRMEKDLQKVKAKRKKASVRGKRKQRDEGDTSQGDTSDMDTFKNLFGLPEVDITRLGQVQPVRDNLAFDRSGTQHQEIVTKSQESMQFGSQPIQEGLDGSQPAQ